MASILLYGSTKDVRRNKLDELLQDLSMEQDENNPDLVVIDTPKGKKSIGIEQVRVATKFLNEKPFSHKDKVIVIDNAHLLTVQAQNALLKTLEEPPSYATIILNVRTENDLLKTVVSRCKKIKAESSEVPKSDGKGVGEIVEMDMGERLFWVLEFAKEDRNDVLKTLESWIHELRKDLNVASTNNIVEIQRVITDLEKTNVSLKLALENLCFKLKPLP